MSFALWNCVLPIFSTPSWSHGQKIVSYFWPTSLVYSMEDQLYVCKAQRSCQLSFTASSCVLGKACCITGILRAISKCLPSSQPEISTCSFFLIPVERTVQQTCQNHNLPTYKQYSPFLCPNHQPPLTVETELLTVNYWYSPACPGWLYFSFIRVFFSVAAQNFKHFQAITFGHLWSGQFFCQSLQKGKGAHPADLCSPPCRNMAQSTGKLFGSCFVTKLQAPDIISPGMATINTKFEGGNVNTQHSQTGNTGFSTYRHPSSMCGAKYQVM